ncbi:MAG: hypothetical protein WA211_18280 [Candidatus Acidiferrales bacterium]
MPDKIAERQSPFTAQDLTVTNREWMDWFQKHCLKWVMFGFVVGIDIWWTKNVLRMVWISGTARATFHLDNTVLIALVSTSIGNFIALVAIVAKNLFPAQRDSNALSR